MHVTKRPFVYPYTSVPIPFWVTPTIALAVTLLLISLPMFLAIRRVKNLEM